MKAIFNWEVNHEGFIFTCKVQQRFLKVDEWAKYELTNQEGNKVRIGPILRMIEDEVASEKDHMVTVSHRVIAKLDPYDLRQLTLPEPSPFTLHIESTGLISDPDFTILCNFWRSNDLPVIHPKRKGCLLLVGTKKYILTDPHYSIIKAIDEVNSVDSKDTEKKFSLISIIKQNLTSDIKINGYLSSINIVKAHYFSIDPFLNEKGEPDFDPVLVRLIDKNERELADSGSQGVERVIPKAKENSFFKQFRNGREVKQKYAVGDGWIVVISDTLREALKVVREYQHVKPEVRRQFIGNPYPFLKEKLGHILDEATLNYIFQETSEYGERVKEIGCWSPPVLPFIRKVEKEPWLPPETLGIIVGDKYIIIDPKDIKDFREKVINAIEKENPFIDYKSEKIPATKDTLEAIDKLVGELSPCKTKDLFTSESHKKYVLIIKGNFEELEIQCKREKRPGIREKISYDLIKTKLLPHQMDGLKWLQDHWISGSSGAILADDMGLGKTLQTLAFLAWIRNFNKGPLLVVAPTGLLDEWAQQARLHLQEKALGTLIKAYGNTLKELRKKKGKLTKDIESGIPILDTTKLSEADWILATYETIRDYQHSFGQIKWRVIVFDEAQKIKNPTAMITCAAKALQTDFAIALTGTPVENRAADIWCIVDAVRPGELGSLKNFSKKYERKNDWAVESLKGLNYRLTKKTKPPILLRRQKSNYLQGLPPKNEHIVREIMPSVQSEAYNKVVMWAKKNSPRRGGILEVLHKLRSVSLHPLDMKAVELSDTDYIKSSARLVSTFKILDKIANKNEKALIFLESLTMQGYLSELIQKRYKLDTPPMIINGAIRGPKRKERVELFQKKGDFDVLILSPKAGGVGFTLTAANHVIHLSRWWNPAVEDQCTDRVYRISQNKPVHVYYLLAIHPIWREFSFDLKLHELISKKRMLFNSIMAPPSGTQKDLEQLYMETIGNEQLPNSSEKEFDDLLNEIDFMDPIQFEEWVLSKLKEVGYNVYRTPISGDQGADVVAKAPYGTDWSNLIIQVKHTQRNTPCPDQAILQVCKAEKSYPQISKPIIKVVVTNANGFTSSAFKLAKREKVLLIDRQDLCNWPKEIMKKII